jgi:hypothetical protein
MDKSGNDAIVEKWLERFDDLLNTNVNDQLEDAGKIGNLEDLEPDERDRLCCIVVRISGYRSRGPGFDSQPYKIF